jgi:hypothetical protein
MAYFVRKDYCNHELNEKLPVIPSDDIYMFYSVINGVFLSVRFWKNNKYFVKALIFRRKI